MAKRRQKKTARKRPQGPGPTKPGGTDPVGEFFRESAPDEFPAMPSLEGLLATTCGPDGGLDPAAEAQELIYEAWESPPRRALELAREALELSADCADAYCILARNAKKPSEAMGLYRKGVIAGERAVGAQAFEEDVGHFWGLLETRPYMRARAGLAASLWTAGEEAEAVQHYRDMLRLNPGDNQGLRYLLMGCLLQGGAWDDAEKLHAAYADDGMATWAYSRVLLDYHRGGDAPTARRALERAVGVNAHVPTYLLGEKELPAELPPYHGFGDANEAILYVADHGHVWRARSDALDWLREMTP